jgi:hypothetical protein
VTEVGLVEKLEAGAEPAVEVVVSGASDEPVS